MNFHKKVFFQGRVYKGGKDINKPPNSLSPAVLTLGKLSGVVGEVWELRS